ncbi:MAG: DUF1275 domain-containing protein [Blastochloris viridis]|uniref:DUF1275 domain-containing protein n=1 Tax=Blastochloris viridis TaxID=1079 RepID=A0A6N4R646_BLAVI|nr:MAG: DUF1275 domain-containing protein [Blastochloris viridis]
MRHLTHHVRTPMADARLGLLLAFIAGGINAGGALAIGRYTSHMTGFLSTLADEVTVGRAEIAWIAVLALVSFFAGTILAAVLVNYSRQTRPHRQWALPLFLEGLLIAAFGIYGTCLPQSLQYPAMGMMLLCGIMGLQNATITKIAPSPIRTTHVTGMFTDLGIEVGRWLFAKLWPLVRQETSVLPLPDANIAKARALAGLISSFFIGGLVGAFGFSFAGLGFAFPFAAILVALTWPTVRTKAEIA